MEYLFSYCSAQMTKCWEIGRWVVLVACWFDFWKMCFRCNLEGNCSRAPLLSSLPFFLFGGRWNFGLLCWRLSCPCPTPPRRSLRYTAETEDLLPEGFLSSCGSYVNQWSICSIRWSFILFIPHFHPPFCLHSHFSPSIFCPRLAVFPSFSQQSDPPLWVQPFEVTMGGLLCLWGWLFGTIAWDRCSSNVGILPEV